MSAPTEASLDFIREIVAAEMEAGKHKSVVTRFPPEPNAYLHIGHAKAVWINYGIALDFKGAFNLRFDDTNPVAEDQEFVDGILFDVRWLGADWGDRLFFASDYFDRMYGWAEELVRKGKAYVCDLSAEQVSEYRGAPTAPGKNSPFRERAAEENLDLFRRMRAGEFPDGSRTLRAKIDMASGNLNLRDPVMYRILHTPHHRQKGKWCIYPMYDWAHGLEDSIEGITHSLCSLEYENHRPLYDWFIDAINEGRTDDGSGLWGKKIHHPRQIEFSRYSLTHTVMSKRKFIELVEGGYVAGFDDPRLPTLAGLRRRGVPPESIREFCERVGIGKVDTCMSIDGALLDHCVRERLNRLAPRRMAVLRPLRVVIDNYPEGQVEQLDVVNNPEDPSAGTRKVPFSRALFIEQDDFREDPPKEFFRLAPGREVRLRCAYFVKCVGVSKDAEGRVTELHCTYDPATRGGDAPDKRKVKATLHWVSAGQSIPAEVRLFGHLFAAEYPEDVPEGTDWKAGLNPKSLETLTGCRLEPSLAQAKPGEPVQFERLGYFCLDKDSTASGDPIGPGDGGKPVFNRTVTLKDTWAKVQKAGKK
ncbi:MAG: glutamine--tRNA ligase/YqeY domain fusion protein [Elusimicrobiota bacterium]